MKCRYGYWVTEVSENKSDNRQSQLYQGVVDFATRSWKKALQKCHVIGLLCDCNARNCLHRK